MSALLGDEVKQLDMEDDKSDSAGKSMNKSMNKSPTKGLSEDVQENVIGSKGRQHEKNTNNKISPEEIEINKTNYIGNSVHEQSNTLATSLLTSFKGRNTSMPKINNSTAPDHYTLNGQNMENTWNVSRSGKEPMRNNNVLNADNTIGQEPNGKVSGKYCIKHIYLFYFFLSRK